MSLDGEGIVLPDPGLPRQSPNARVELLKALCPKASEIDENALGVAEKDIRERDRLLVPDEGDPSVHRFESIVAEGVDLLAEQMLKTEKAGCG